MTDAAFPPLGRRILIWGGGGKTSLSRAIGEELGLPVIEMDAINWLPNWTERDPEEFRQLVHEAIGEHPDAWVVDGNYAGKIGGEVLELADTLIWLDLPWRVVFWRTARRAVARARDKRLICGENIESWRQTFCSRNSMIWWYITLLPRWGQRRQRRAARIAEFGALATVIRLESARALDDFYESHGLLRPEQP